MKKKPGYVWIVDRTLDGGFKPKKILKERADKVNIKQHKTEAEAWKTISQIHIEPDH